MITITKHSKHKDATLGAWKYWHTIQYPHTDWKYDCNMTNEGMMYLIQALRKAGNEVVFNEVD